jgi:hypothetical protein
MRRVSDSFLARYELGSPSSVTGRSSMATTGSGCTATPWAQGAPGMGPA